MRYKTSTELDSRNRMKSWMQLRYIISARALLCNVYCCHPHAPAVGMGAVSDRDPNKLRVLPNRTESVFTSYQVRSHGLPGSFRAQIGTLVVPLLCELRRFVYRAHRRAKRFS